MSESTVKRLKREITVLEQDNARLRERLDVARMKEIKLLNNIEIKLLNNILELRDRVRELEGEE